MNLGAPPRQIPSPRGVTHQLAPPDTPDQGIDTGDGGKEKGREYITEWRTLGSEKPYCEATGNA